MYIYIYSLMVSLLENSALHSIWLAVGFSNQLLWFNLLNYTPVDFKLDACVDIKSNAINEWDL